MDINTLLKEAVERGASDLHLTVGVPPLLRLDGTLVEMNQPAVKPEETSALTRQLLTKEKTLIFEENGEIDTSYNHPGLGFFRVNCYRQRGVTNIAIRMLNAEVFSLDQLELPKPLATFALRNRGLILITGPTGSGKSTTLAAMIDLINAEKAYHIITLEDPIEYFHTRKKSVISQREIGRDSRSFPNALRAALRQDPDVIMVGEMRDLETISIAITAAETGHLVLATLHTIDAAQTVERIIDVFPADQQRQIRAQLANSLGAIVSQRLIPRKDGTGRLAAVEILNCTPAIRNLIREGKIHQIPSAIQSGSKFGMQTIDKHLQMLYEAGLISKEDSLEHSRDEIDMVSYFERTRR